jgi:hypothetical protein
MDLDRWVNDNNPDEQLQYSKGWWDYIELIRRLMYKFGAKRNHLFSSSGSAFPVGSIPIALSPILTLPRLPQPAVVWPRSTWTRSLHIRVLLSDRISAGSAAMIAEAWFSSSLRCAASVSARA